MKTKNTKDILLKKGLKPTYQRIAIYDFLDKNRIHPTVDKIYAMLYPDIPTISKTTIYNTLKLFMKKNLVKGLTIGGAEKHYDVNVTPHHHFYCCKCGRVFDIDIHCPFYNNKQAMVDGNLVQEIHGYFKGTCKNCI
ncbi:MAG: Fur family transcriptional regulator [Fidelibacterota bacterium]